MKSTTVLALLGIFVLFCTIGALDAEAATISNMFSTTHTSGEQIIIKLCAALNGYMGWMIILFGGVLGAWEYFVQRQGHLLVAIVIGCVAIIFLGKIMRVAYPNCA